MTTKCCGGNCGALAAAFRELTLALMGVFTLHGADPELVESAADALGLVFKGQLARGETAASETTRGPMEALLDDLDAATKARS